MCPVGSRVEHHVVISPHQVIVGQERREFIESGDLSRTCARELLLDALEGLVWQDAAHGTDDPLSVLRCRVLRIDLDRIEARNLRDRRQTVADISLEHLANIGGWVGANEQHRLAFVDKAERRRAGQRRLAELHPYR